MPAVVALSVSPTEVKVQMAHGKVVSITGKGLDFVKKALQPKAKEDLKIVPGSVLRIAANKDGSWEITQIPQAEAAFVATKYDTGAIQALVGGYDFALNKFNHVTQAWRQPAPPLSRLSTRPRLKRASPRRPSSTTRRSFLIRRKPALRSGILRTTHVRSTVRS